ISVEIKDSQNEIIPISDLRRTMNTWMDRGAPISDTHCYSQDTRILTDVGLKLFKDLNKNDKVATLNPITHEFEFQKPIEKQSFKYQGNMIIVVSINVIFLITITYFIWSNFNSIYNSNAYYLCVKKIIFDLLNNNEIPSLENTDPKVYVHPDIITKELNHRLKSLQPFRKLNRPLIIVFSFWINFILPKRFKINIGRNLAIQEAALYTLIFLSTIILWFLITIDIFC
ncbi:MAG: hypothetical protein IIA49_12510, partial [Bacteroidetes bacterium]|nr:hypothetical protein [Bacteroidota bacterium]